ncbi:uroporphyrinogen decarboxylase family protein [Chloroflexota bacterium]
MDKSPDELYQERLQRVEDAVQLKVPDRVPTVMTFGYLGAKYAGMTVEEVFYDPDKWVMANQKIITDFAPDMFQNNPALSGTVFETIDTRVMRWPGHGVSANHSIQFVEGEYMKADEYDSFIADPADYVVRTHLPRTCGALAPLQKLPRLTDFLGLGEGRAPISVLAGAELVAACGALSQAARETKKWQDARSVLVEEMKAKGFPALSRAGLAAPFDYISDFLRGMKGTMLDMYRQPAKLLEAMEVVLAFSLQKIESMKKIEPMEKTGENKLLFIAPHRGADGFMSLKQFEQFYWPGLKAVILALVEAGFTPYMFWEGEYTSRLEYLLELPEGKILNRFDRVDMVRVKEVLGGHQCIAGGIMPSLLQTGTVQDVKDQCKKLIDVVGRDGGFIMMTSCETDEAKPENVKAMIDFTREYGVYK